MSSRRWRKKSIFRALGEAHDDVRLCRLLVGLALLVPLVVPSFVAAEPSGPGVTVETNRRAYVVGDVVQIKVTNSRDTPIFLPGCEIFQLERFAEEAYRSIPLEPCVREEIALMLPPGTRTFEYRPGRAQLKQLLRVSLVFGWGCGEGKALSSARCDDFTTVRSSSFRLSHQPE